MRGLFLVAAAAVALPLTAAAQPLLGAAERAGGPLHSLGAAGGLRPALENVGMMAGPRPQKRPAAPVEVWSWTFWREPRGEGDLLHDTMAFRLRVDCAAATMQRLVTEIYREGAFVAADDRPGHAEAPKPGSFGHARIRMACDPGFARKAPAYPDHRAARAAAMKLFGRAGR